MTGPLLSALGGAEGLREVPRERLGELAAEVRQATIDAVSVTGGHLGAGLGVVELTVALHYVFDTPTDKVIWDVGHQAYPHKIVTGRLDRIKTLRQPGGLSGFTKRAESAYDPFGAAHSSTSISAGLGMAAARDLKLRQEAGVLAGSGTGPAGTDGDFNVVAVIGDGAMSAGMAYEAMNNAGALKSRLIVILNDNDMSIAPNVGAMHNYLSRVVSSESYRSVRHVAKQLTEYLPRPLAKAAGKVEEYARGLATGGTLFEEMGFYYVGPVDGHDLDQLVPILENVRDFKDGPVLIHAVTEKGRGFAPAKAASDKCHAVGTFDRETLEQKKKAASAPSYTSVFAKALIQAGEADPAICGITAAMPAGTGIAEFQKRFPERTFDVGIAEQHAVTFAAGLACEGLKPFCAIYSTFLQRAYDQVVHDVALQSLPVRFAIDRAGLVGADGPTHAGAFDLSYLGCLPGFVVMAAADEAELMHMVATCAAIDDAPSAVRYPRGEGTGVALPERGEVLALGKGRIVREGSRIALLSLGTRLQPCLEAADRLAKSHGTGATVADARFLKPLDTDLVEKLARQHDILITVEENASGGFGSLVQQHLLDTGLLDAGRLKLRSLVLPDRFIDHNKPEVMYDQAGLNAEQIAQTAAQLLPQTKPQISAAS